MQGAEDKLLRKSCEELMVSGTAMIAFGAWSFIRLFVQTFMNRRQIMERFYPDGMNDEFEWLMFILTLLVISGIGLAFHLLTGLGARAEAQGKRAGILYLVVAAFIGYYYFSRDLELILNILAENYEEEQNISFLIDISFLFVLVEMFRSAIRVKRLRKHQKTAAINEGQSPGGGRL